MVYETIIFLYCSFFGFTCHQLRFFITIMKNHWTNESLVQWTFRAHLSMSKNYFYNMPYSKTLYSIKRLKWGRNFSFSFYLYISFKLRKYLLMLLVSISIWSTVYLFKFFFVNLSFWIHHSQWWYWHRGLIPIWVS